jgi:RimJ/RimL family protein N-acetyltransferase
MPFPDLTLPTERLVLRPFRRSDAPAVQAAGSDPLTQTWLPLPAPYTLSDARDWIGSVIPSVEQQGNALVRAITLGGEVAGAIDFKPTDWRTGETEIGYWTVPAFRGRGVMPEAVSAYARWALTSGGLQRVVLRIAPGNTASTRVAEKSGFTFEGVARNASFTHAGRTDLAIYSLIPADLAAS